MRLAAFEQVRRISEVHGHLTGATEFEQGITFEDRCIPIVNRQRDIFKPKEMRFLLSIRTIFPKPGGRVWYHDQRHVHQQIFEGSEAVDYAIMGTNPDAADNRWLRAAYENRVPVIYFPGIAPSRYQAIAPSFISGSDPAYSRRRFTFGMLDQDGLAAAQNASERRHVLTTVKRCLHQASFRER